MLTFETWDIEKLIPYDRNPRVNDHAVDKIASAIKEYGFRVPIVAKSDGLIVDGHLRFKAARKLGLTEIPVILADDLTDAQIKAFRLSVNKMAELATWDEEMLAIEMQELHDIGYDLDLIGFTPEELEEMDIDFEGSLEAIIDESKADDVPEVVENPVIKLGDLIELGNHRLLCGDSTKEDDVKRLMDGKKADMVFTDPPYGISYDSPSDKHKIIKNDNVFLDGWIPLVQQYSKGFIFMWTGYQVVHKWIEIGKPFGDITNMIIWAKGGGGLGDLKKRFATDFEIALVWNRGAELQDKRIGSVWSINKDNGVSYVHPTQKPVELMEKGIFNCSFAKSIVMDLFLGSGSTLIACENLNRKCYGMELDEKYAQVIIQRWCDYTSIDTIKINGKEVSWSEYKESQK